MMVFMKRFWKSAAGFIRRHWPLSALLALAVGYLMVPHKLEQLFVYYPTRQVSENPALVGLSYQDVYLVTDDHVRLHGWFIPCADADNTLLIFHGNAGNIGDRLSWIELLHNLDVHVFIIDYRGYGKSEGAPFERGLYSDAHAAYDWWAHERQSNGEKLIIMEESLGGAVAVHLAARVFPAGLIIQSSFTSAWDMAKTMLPIGLLQPLINVHFDSAKEISRVTCPKLVIHGARDEIVPFRLGKRLYELALPPKSLYVVPEAGHNDLLWMAGPEYSRRLRIFLSGIV
jgi:fermentation-respiration switch protein FrsA (DUF1100 family)